jgi:orotidine-5'-phosphate decarboxylase
VKRCSQVVLAVDVTERSRAVEVVREVAEFVDAVKVGYPLVLSCGLGIVGELSRFTPVIADFKVADIPNTDRLICRLAFEAGAAGVIVHGFTGEDSVGACVDVAREYGGEVFVVCEMSHPGGARFFQSVALELARLAERCGAEGIVAPATRPERIRMLKEASGNLTVLSPGVGVQGGNAVDALRAGADFVIVGRSIYESEHPKMVVERMVREIEALRR